jgi:protein SCO1/2
VRVFLTLAFASAIASAACGAGTASRQYQVRGQVISVDRVKSQITIKHEDIRGFMPAMTMTFNVSDQRLLDGRQPGELITAALVVDGSTGFLSAIQHTGTAPLAETPPPAPVDVLRDGDEVPDAEFSDEHGRPRRFSEWRGQAVAVTFIYTRCPLPDFCPLMDRNFREVQTEIERDASLRERAHLVSVTFDPVFDTPQVLAAHSTRAGAEPARWTMLTGERDRLDRFTSRFGVSVIRRDTPGAEIVHNLRTAVIDPRGRIVTILSGNEWTPSELLGHLKGALRQ